MSSFTDTVKKSTGRKPLGLIINTVNIEQQKSLIKTPVNKSTEDIIKTLLPGGTLIADNIQEEAINNYNSLNSLPPNDDAMRLFNTYKTQPDNKKILVVHNRKFPGEIQYTTIVIEEDNFIYKFFVYDCKDASTVDAYIIREITIQLYASTIISRMCDFSTPGIYNYNKFNEMIKGMQKCIFYFKMDKMSLQTLEKIIKNDLNLDTLIKVRDKLTDINTCIEDKNIFHNDLNSGNILIDDKIKEFGIIDFGEATTTQKNITDANFEKILDIIRKKIDILKSNQESESNKNSRKRPLDAIYPSRKSPVNDVKSRKRTLSDVYTTYGGLKKTGKNTRKKNKNTKKRKTYNKRV